jgi:hypothetical protein
MTSETGLPNEPTIVSISPATEALVETELQDEPDEVRRETKALFEAIRTRAQVELQSAGDLTREAYLNAVRQAREAIEQDKLIDRERIDQAIELIQQEAEKNWNLVLAEIEALGTRLAEAAKIAWSKLTDSQSDQSPNE